MVAIDIIINIFMADILKLLLQIQITCFLTKVLDLYINLKQRPDHKYQFLSLQFILFHLISIKRFPS